MPSVNDCRKVVERGTIPDIRMIFRIKIICGVEDPRCGSYFFHNIIAKKHATSGLVMRR